VEKASTAHAVLVVEPLVLPTGVDADVGFQSPPLLLTLVLMLMLATLVGGVRMIHHPVLWRSTTEWSCHNLSLHVLLVSADHIVHDDDIVNEL
jgi:hypothetical protein